MKTLLITAVAACSAVARADTPELVSQNAGAFAVSLPKGWTVVEHAAPGTVVAQQDPKRKDAAQLMVVLATHTQASDDQVLDALLKDGLADAKVTTRQALPNGAGKLLIAEGKADGITARLGAIALSGAGAVIVGVLVAKPGDFEVLGGTNTVVTVLASVRITGAATTATPPAATVPTANGGARDPIMTPEYSYGSLIIPPAQRTLDILDLVGEWSGNDGAGRVYMSSNGVYAGFSTLSTAETWTIDAEGNAHDAFSAGFASSSGAHGFTQNSAGTVAVNANNTISFHYPAQNGNKARDENYIIVGWFVGPEMTLLRLQGPFYEPLTEKDLNDALSKSYMNHTFVTKRLHP